MKKFVIMGLMGLMALIGLMGCVNEEEFDNSPQGNLDALWKIIDEHYCFCLLIHI